MLYREGSVPYLRLQDAAGTVLLERGFPAVRRGEALVRRRLAPGKYTVVSWQRPCDGNCGYLDPPTDRCRGTVAITAAHITRVSVRLRPGRGCRIASARQ